MLHATLVEMPIETDSERDPSTLLDVEDRAAMALLRMVTVTALAIGLLGLVVRWLA
ncbi:MAG: hypothetical protein HY855_01745 [Burkholderiales bacterium]|nr:hypothetical protein [Burkholderiales bacterium]